MVRVMAGAGRTTIVVNAHLVHPRANDPGPYLISVMGLSFLAFFAIFIQLVVGAIALAAVLAAAIWSARTRNRWVLDDTTLTCCGLVERVTVPFAQLSRIEIHVVHAYGYERWVAVTRRGRRHEIWPRGLQDALLGDHLAQFAPHVPFDRADRWPIRRVAGPIEDPRRSLGSVRHAMVGPWEVRVVPVTDGFRARARHERSSEERRCPDRPTLAEAMDDAMDLIDDLEPAQT
jgi:hypothetical protein